MRGRTAASPGAWSRRNPPTAGKGRPMRAPSLRRGIALTLGLAAGVAWMTAAPAFADRHHTSGDDRGRESFSASVLVADDPAVGAPITDPNLVNPWGITFGPTTPL